MFDTGRLGFFAAMAGTATRKVFLRHLAPARQQRWVVYAKPPFAGPQAILADLLSVGTNIDFYGWTVPSIGWAGATGPAFLLLDWALPALFYVMVTTHLGAVLKRHFGEGEKSAVRRMLR